MRVNVFTSVIVGLAATVVVVMLQRSDKYQPRGKDPVPADVDTAV